jgi:hypothetical protein
MATGLASVRWSGAMSSYATGVKPFQGVRTEYARKGPRAVWDFSQTALTSADAEPVVLSLSLATRVQSGVEQR